MISSVLTHLVVMVHSGCPSSLAESGVSRDGNFDARLGLAWSKWRLTSEKKGHVLIEKWSKIGGSPENLPFVWLDLGVFHVFTHHFQAQIRSLQDKTTLRPACMSKEHTAKASSHLQISHHQDTRMFKAVGQASGMCRLVSNERPSLAFNLAMHRFSFEPSKLRLKANHQIMSLINPVVILLMYKYLYTCIYVYQVSDSKFFLPTYKDPRKSSCPRISLQVLHEHAQLLNPNAESKGQDSWVSNPELGIDNMVYIYIP